MVLLKFSLKSKRGDIGFELSKFMKFGPAQVLDQAVVPIRGRGVTPQPLPLAGVGDALAHRGRRGGHSTAGLRDVSA